MFEDCIALESLNLNGLNTENVTDMTLMFSNCSSLSNLNLNGFKTDNVKEMIAMFYGCSSLTSLDISSFNTRKAIRMNQLFQSCSKLKTIYVSNLWSLESLQQGEIMFRNCHQLVGGQGTAYNIKHEDYSYARIDGGPNAPGYFTYKEPSDIKNVVSTELSNKHLYIYDLNGQHLATTQKGINIINGQKVIVK